MYLHHGEWFFMQNVNLIFHEAGHVLFIFFGNFMSILGATITELGIPLTVSLYFLYHKQLYSAGFGFWWLSTALYSVSVYAADAHSRVLPLITGDPGTHDWYNMLSQLGWLRFDSAFGNFFMVLSFLSLAGAVFCMYQGLEKSEKYSSHIAIFKK